jgi:hypothetical protein
MDAAEESFQEPVTGISLGDEGREPITALVRSKSEPSSPARTKALMSVCVYSVFVFFSV